MRNVLTVFFKNASVPSSLTEILEEEIFIFPNIYTLVEQSCLPPDLYQSFLPASHAKILSDLQKQYCEGVIYEDELRQAINSYKSSETRQHHHKRLNLITLVMDESFSAF